MKHWFTALHIRERYIARQAEVQRDLHERVHRLEIRDRENREKIEALEERLERLRLRADGLRGGRPRRADDQQPLPLDQIPHGDKAALRRALGVVK